MGKLTYLEAFFSIFLWILLILKYKCASKIKNQGKGNYVFFTIILILFSTFGYISGGDFFSYQESYESAYRISEGHWEPFFNFIMLNLPYGYFYWRFVIWGISSIIIVLAFKRINCPPNLTCWLFLWILLSYFPTARNALGYVVLYYSLTFILQPTKIRFISYSIAILGIICSSMLHKSMPLYIFLGVIALFPIKNIRYYGVSLLLFPILYKSVYIISSYLLTFNFSGEDFQERGSLYLEGENFAGHNLMGYIDLLVSRVPLILILVYILIHISQGKIENKVVLYFSRYSYLLMYISFLFFDQDVSSFLSPRFWDASLFSLVLVFPLALYHDRSNFIRRCVYFMIGGTIIYKMIYPIYTI